MKFASYSVESRIASGGTADVYVGRDSFDRAVALKILHPHLSDDAEFVRMFLTEGRLAGLLRHPHITRAYEVGSVDGRLFIAMEVIAGPPLAALLALAAGAPWPLPRAYAVMRPVLEALHYAHVLVDASGEPLGVVHRDVTPANILLSRDAVVKVTDFGSAKSALSAVRTRTGLLKGRFAYMSPEQARGRPVDCRSDVFSAGLVCYELLQGSPAYTGEDDHSLLEQAAAAAVPALTGHSPALSAAVAGALRSKAEERYATCAEFLAALGAADTIDVAAGQAELAALVADWARAHPAVTVAPTPQATLLPAARSHPPRRQGLLPLAVMSLVALLLALSFFLLPSEDKHGARASAQGRNDEPSQPASLPSAPSTPLPPPQPPPFGRLTINTLPWSRVLIDGQEVAPTTPLVEKRVPAGHHNVTLICTNGKRKTFSVDVHEAETVSRFFDMAAEGQ